MILTCCKTGRHWRLFRGEDGNALARRLGLKDYTIEEGGRE